MLENDTKRTAEVKLTVTNQIKLDPLNPIPIQYGGNSFPVVLNKKYIPLLGRDNNLPNLLLEARLTSTTQNACITSIASSVIGNGLSILEVEKPDETLLEWMKSVNNDQQSFDDIMLGAVDGERSQGNQFIELVKGSFAGKSFLKVYLHSSLYCRLSAPETAMGKPQGVIISTQFGKRGYRGKGDTRTVPLYSTNPLDQKKCWFKDTEGNLRTMLHFKNEVSGIDHYGLPASFAGLRHQVHEGKLVQYNIDNLDNNMILGGMLAFKSAMTAEEAQRNAKEILLSHVGDGKTGRIAVISSESGLDEVQFTPYNTQKEGSFIEMDKRVEEKIIAANGWDGALCGISQGGKLGNGSGYIRSIWDSKEAQLLNPLRRKLLDKVITPIMKIYADVYKNNEILKYKFWFNSAMPYSFLGELNPDNFIQVNEARELAGHPADESKKGVYLSELKSKADVQAKPAPKEGANNS